MSLLHVLITTASLGLLVLVLELVRRKHLREKYALVWLFVSTLLILISLSPGMLDIIAKKIGVLYGPSLLFMVGIFVLLVITIMLSVIVSHQTSRIISLVQEQGLLENRLRLLESNEPTKKKPVGLKK